MDKIKGVDILNAVAGIHLAGDMDIQVKDISIDSRKIDAGTAFFSLKGERADGHDFISDAIKKGAVAIITEREDILPEDHKGEPLFIKVKSSERALSDLAAWYIGQFKIHKVAVTGSTGKTTTKEMLYNIFSKKYVTVCNQGNFNNLIGLPLSVFQVDRTTEAAIFEMGMDRFGEIQRLAEIIKPHAAIITNIGLSHLEGLGSQENILKAKMEISHFMDGRNTLIVNGDDALLSQIKEDKKYRLMKVGKGGSADLRIRNIKNLGEKGTEFTLETDIEKVSFHIGAPGLHNVMNGSLAAAAALSLGIKMEDAASGLEEFEGSHMRLNIISAGGFKIIDDTYNASPDSMKAAIDVLDSLKSNRKIAILGDMFELGKDEEKYHRDIGEYASQKGIDVVISVGKNARHISLSAKGDKTEAFHFDEKDMLINVLAQWIRKGDAILIKGSRGMAMDEISEQLKLIKK